MAVDGDHLPGALGMGGPGRVVPGEELVGDPRLVLGGEVGDDPAQRAGQFEGDVDRSVGHGADARVGHGASSIEGEYSTKQERVGFDQQPRPVVVPLQVQRVGQVLSVVPTGFDKEAVLDAPLQQG